MGPDVLRDTFAALRGPHQREGVLWMCRRESHPGAVPSAAGGILADEMGMGKTYEVAALMRLRPMRTLVVTTLSTLLQWQEVLSTRLLALPFVLRTRDQAEVVGFSRARTVLTTYSLFQRCEAARLPDPLRLWGRVVLDEAHTVRNPKCRTYRCLCQLSAAHRWALTGTPVNNAVGDLHALVAWLGAPGLEVGLVRTHLLLRRTLVGESHRSPELGGIPSLTVVDSVVVLSPGERRAYDLLESACSEHGSFAHAMESILRCRQACTHLSIMEEAIVVARGLVGDHARSPMQRALSRVVATDVPSAKLTRLLELVGAHRHAEKSLIFCDWLREMDIVGDALETVVGVPVVRYAGGMDLGQRQAALRTFETTEHAVLLAQIQCGGLGLNLQGASRVYMMRPAWNPCVELQAIARAHRAGQTRPVVVTRLIAADSVDVRCTEVQAQKLSVIDSVMCGRGEE